MSTVQSSWATENLSPIFLDPSYLPKMLTRDEFNLVLRRVQTIPDTQDLCDAMILIAYTDIDLSELSELRWEMIDIMDEHLWVQREGVRECQIDFGSRVGDLLECRRLESMLQPRCPFVFGAEPDVTRDQLSMQLANIAVELGMPWLDFATVQRSAGDFFLE